MSQFYFYPPTSSNSLPAGSATAANQVLEIAQLTAINSNTTGSSTAANQTTEIAAINSFAAKTASAFVNVPFDETVITYVGATTNIATVVYKLATVTKQTLTLTYDGSNRLIDVLKS